MKKIVSFLFALICVPTAYANTVPLSNHSVFLDILRWNMREGGADNWGQNITSNSAQLFDSPFQWKTGFRLGGNYHTQNSFWDTCLYWTTFQTKAVNAASGRIFSAFLGNFFANNTNGGNFGPFYNQANMQWKFAYNTLDLEWGGTFESDKVVSLHPFFGLKGAVINQKLDTIWQGPNTSVSNVTVPITTFSTATETLENNFWGVGPSLGLKTTWPLYETSNTHVSLIGHVSAALLWGHWQFNDRYQNNTPVSITVNFNDIDGAAPMTSALVGIEWVKQLPKEKNLRLQLSYEGQVWFNQLQYYSLNTGRLNSLMSLHGGMLRVAYEF